MINIDAKILNEIVANRVQHFKGLCTNLDFSWNLRMVQQASLVAQLVKNPPTMRETWVRSLGWEDPLEKGKATHSSILAWRIPWTTVQGVAKSQTHE